VTLSFCRKEIELDVVLAFQIIVITLPTTSTIERDSKYTPSLRFVFELDSNFNPLLGFFPGGKFGFPISDEVHAP